MLYRLALCILLAGLVCSKPQRRNEDSYDGQVEGKTWQEWEDWAKEEGENVANTFKGYGVQLSNKFKQKRGEDENGKLDALAGQFVSWLNEAYEKGKSAAQHGQEHGQEVVNKVANTGKATFEDLKKAIEQYEQQEGKRDWGSVWDNMKAKGQSVSQSAQNHGEEAYEKGKTAVQHAQVQGEETVDNLANKGKSAYKKGVDWAKNTGENAENTFKQKRGENDKDKLDDLADQFVGLLNEAYEKGKAAAQNAQNHGEEVAKNIANSGKAKYEDLKNALGQYGENMSKRDWSSFWNNVKTKVNNGWSTVKTGAQNTWNKVSSGTKNAWDKVKSSVTGNKNQ